jgi:ammonium transporter, Amt family
VGVHGIGGLLGVVLLGVFADTAVNANGGDGLVHGTAGFLGKQVAAGAGACVYAFVFTSAMLRLIDWVTPVRVGEEEKEEEESGLDAAGLGEAAYTFELPGTVSPSAPAP